MSLMHNAERRVIVEDDDEEEEASAELETGEGKASKVVQRVKGVDRPKKKAKTVTEKCFLIFSF